MSLPTRRPLVRGWTVAVVAVSCLSLAGCSDETAPTSGDTAGDTAGGQDGTTPKPAESASDAPSQDPTSSTPDGQSATTVPIYWAGDGPDGRPRLLREFQRVEGDPLLGAARAVAGFGRPLDPDYRTLWPEMEIASVQATDGVLLVSVPTDAFTERPDGMSPRMARLAIQQLVYTLQGVHQERIPVVIEREAGEPSLFGLSTQTGFTAASALRTLNHVSITSPAEGETVTGDTVTVAGVVNSFEASGPCRLLRDGSEVALEPYQADGWMEDRLFPFEVELPLSGATGELVVQCETDDPSGGTEGPGAFVDTKTIVVE